jgi:hypothetical protein
VDEFDLAAAGLLTLGSPSAALPGCGAEFVTCVLFSGGSLGFDSSGVHNFGGNALDCAMGEGYEAAGIAFVTDATGQPTVTPASYQSTFNQGYKAALRDLKRKKCGSFFGGQGPATINGTWYRFLDFGPARTSQGAQTASPTDVQINSTGPYMTYSPVPGTPGPFGLFWTQPQFRAFILLQELGHQLSSVTGFQPDAGNPSLNQQQSMEVIGPCIK